MNEARTRPADEPGPGIGPQERRLLLESMALLGGLGPAVLASLAGALKERFFAPGQVVTAEGDESDTLYIVARGRALVSLREGGRQVPLATLEAGESFGEVALLRTDHRRQASVTAVTPLRLLALDGASLRELVSAHPEFGSALASVAEARQRAGFLKRATPFRPLPPEQLRALAERLERRTLPAGATLLRQGEAGDECYLLRAGALEVLIASPTGERRIGTLCPGCLVGEAALLTDEPRNATVRATAGSEVFVLPRAALLAAFAADRVLEDELGMLLSRRERPERAAGVLVHEQPTAEGEVIRVLEHPGLGSYVRLTQHGWFIWQRLDGLHTVKDLVLESLDTDRPLAPDTVATALAELRRAGCVKTRGLRADVRTPRASLRQRAERTLERLLYRELTWKGADRFFTGLYRRGGGLLFRKPLPALLLAFALSGLYPFFRAGSRASLLLESPERSGPLLLVLVPALVVALVFHETGHALATVHFGRRVRSAGLGWHWLVLFVFVDTTDTWALGRRQRITVTLAGPLTSSVLAGLASWAALWQSNLFGTAALWQFALMANLSLLSNLNPLKARDGYYILSDLLERPNLRQRAFSALARLVPGFRSATPQWRAGWPELLYGAAALVFIGAMTVSSVASYRVVVKAHIDRFLPETLADALPWAIGLLIVTVAALWALDSLRSALRELATRPAAAAPGAAPPEVERRG